MEYQHETNPQDHGEPLYMSHASYFNHINWNSIRSTLCLSINVRLISISLILRVKISFKNIIHQLPNKTYVISMSINDIATLEFVQVIAMAQLKQIAYLLAMGCVCIIVFVDAIVTSLLCCKLFPLMLSQRRSSLLECGDIIGSIDYSSDKQTAWLHQITKQTTLTAFCSSIALMKALFSKRTKIIKWFIWTTWTLHKHAVNVNNMHIQQPQKVLS